MNSLSVCIPTIGRPEAFQAIKSVRYFLGCGLSIQLIIADNSQDLFFSQQLRRLFNELLPLYCKSSTIITHSTRVALQDNWNSAVSCSSCEWTTVLSDDDEYLSSKMALTGLELLQIIKQFNQDPEINLICFSSLVHFNTHRLFLERCCRDISLRIPKLSSILYRSSYLEAIGYFSSEYKYALDYFSLAPSFAGAKYVVHAKALALYRIHQSNLTKQNRQQTYGRLSVFNILEKRLFINKYFGYCFYIASPVSRICLAALFPAKFYMLLRSYPLTLWLYRKIHSFSDRFEFINI